MAFKHCEPAARIIDRLGGTSVVAKVVGKHESMVRRWRLREPVGTGGLVRDDHDKLKLLAYAKRHRIRLTWNDFAPRRR